MGQSVVVDNRSGMSGIVATQHVIRSPADGYVLLMSNAGSHAIAPFMVGTIPFDTLHDLTHLAMLGGSSWMFVVSTESPHQTWADWLRWASGSPTGFTLATPGDGSHGHLIGELLARARSLKWSHVPYKGAPPAVADVVGGHVQAALVTTSSALPLVQAGRLRPLLVTSPRRLPDYPAVPTAAESGLPGLTAFTWFGLAGPAGLDASTKAAIQRAVVKAMSTAEWRERLAASGVEPMDVTPEQTEAFVTAEVHRWGSVARSLAAARPASSRP